MKRANWFKLVLSAAILGGLGLAASEYLNGDALLRAFGRFGAWSLLPIFALGLLYTMLKAWRFVWLLRPVCDLRSGVCLRAYWAGEPAALLPGGVAARAALLHEVGVPVHQSAAPIVLMSLLDQTLFLLGSLASALWYPAARLPVLIILGALLVLGALLAVPALRRLAGRGAHWLAARTGVHEKWSRFLGAAREVTGLPLLLLSLGVTAVSFGVKTWALALCVQALGFELSAATLFFAFVLPTLLGRLSPIPAGVGVTEAGMVGFLVANTALSSEEALAASAVFRIATVFLPALVGALVYFLMWRGARELNSRRPQKG